MKQTLLPIKKSFDCKSNTNTTLLSLLLACSLTACGGSSTDDVNEVDDTDDTGSTVETNTVPVANAGADQTVFVDSTVTLSGSESSDADGDTLTYSWSLSVLPDGSVATLSSDTDITTSFSADVVGSYVISLMVNDAAVNSEIDNVEIIVSEVLDGSTTSVLCDYSYDAYNDSDSVQLDSTVTWSCTDTEREIAANGVPDHAVGTFPNNNNPNAISEQSITDSFTLTPIETSTATTLGGPAGVTGYVLNGVKIDASTAGSCDDSGENCSLIDNSGSWHIEALGQNSFDFGTDDNNAHVQPGGAYHYHGMPEGFITKQDGDDTKMTIIGWAADGFPIYARYGYTVASDSTSAIKAMTGSYQLKTDISTSRPSTDTYALGTFAQDWEYVEGSGDLDECNGRVGVTPEFPQGIYHYYATDTYPYFQRCVTGEVDSAGGPPPQ